MISRDAQLRDGDLRVTALNGTSPFLGRQANIEVKGEWQHTGNLFIEVFSNKRLRRLGWLFNLLRCDELLYGFHDEQILYCLNFGQLWGWCWSKQGRKHDLRDRGRPNIYNYPLVKQKKYEQANDTWGALVPVHHLKADGAIQSVRDLGLVEKWTQKSPAPVFGQQSLFS